MLRIAVCDDDTKFAGGLETIIVQEAGIMGVRTETEVFSDGETLLEEFERGTRYDLIFLDINMKRLDGISTARFIRRVDRMVLIIFISGCEQHLKELFEVEPFRFLSKPLDKARFQRYFLDAVCRIREEDAYYQFSFKKGIRKVALRDILYFESRNRVIHIFLNDGTEEQFYGKLNDVEKQLEENSQRFLRIHQSFLVNYSYIKKTEFSSVLLSVSSGEEIRLKISEDRQKAIRQRLCGIMEKMQSRSAEGK